MIRAFHLMLIGIFWLMNTVCAQDQQKPPEKVKLIKSINDYKWDVSLDIYSLFRGYRNVLLRYAPEEKGAYRLSIDHHFMGYADEASYRDSTTGVISNKSQVVYKVWNYYVIAQLGYEFRKNLGRHQLFYGADIGADFHYLKAEAPYSYTSRRLDCGISPFAGLKYRITDRLSISAETGISVNYHRARDDERHPHPIITSRRFSSYFDPLSAINISYHF
ncbi:hypothetical protein [Dyadobacter bucti]|uniref:hypothetical protein n=1 Tax=Dyadobacter bucti TaxID=2572203 RepID=UPI003F6F6978